MIIPKIDIHCHVAKMAWTCRKDGTRGPTAEEMMPMHDSLGVDRAVILPFLSPEYNSTLLTNEDAYLIAQKYPERYYWFCNIDPRFGEYSPETDFSDRMEFYIAHGARGIGELSAPLPFDHPLYLNLFKYAEKYNLPVLFHIGDGKYNDYGIADEIGLPRLEKVLGMFPNLTFIGHSQKFWAEIGNDVTEENRNDYPTGKVTPGRLPYLLDNYPNLHCDFSAGSGGNAMTRDPEYAVQFMEKYQDRLYFGCDVCHLLDDPNINFPLSHFLDELVESGKLTQEAYNKICRDNILKILEK